MALEKFRASPLPVPPSDYNQQYMTQLIRVIGLYFSQLDSLTPLQTDRISLLALPTSGYGLRDGAVFRVGEDLKIVVPNVAYTLGVSGTGGVGSVTVTTS